MGEAYSSYGRQKNACRIIIGKSEEICERIILK
jgi:hypothetical protein